MMVTLWEETVVPDFVLLKLDGLVLLLALLADPSAGIVCLGEARLAMMVTRWEETDVLPPVMWK
jgi:hypothetical protein